MAVTEQVFLQNYFFFCMCTRLQWPLCNIVSLEESFLDNYIFLFLALHKLQCACGSQRTTWKSQFFSLHHVDSGDWTQGIRLCNKSLYPLNNFSACPLNIFDSSYYQESIHKGTLLHSLHDLLALFCWVWLKWLHFDANKFHNTHWLWCRLRLWV